MPMSLREEPEELRDRLLELTVGSEAEPAAKTLRGAAEGRVELIGEVVDPDPRLWGGPLGGAAGGQPRRRSPPQRKKTSASAPARHPRCLMRVPRWGSRVATEWRRAA